MKNIVILGSTGSIGTQALQVVRLHPDRFRVVGLAAGNNADLLLKQALEFKPAFVCINDREKMAYLQQELSGTQTVVLSGDAGLMEIASLPEVDTVLVAIVGVRALLPTVRAIELGKNIALASKEILVAAGRLVMDLIKKNKVAILPVDSEHAAIMQCLQGNDPAAVETLTLTASGGPFFGLSAEEISKRSLADALNHPNWDMGRKITIDSASLINKGLEVIEAHWLFGVDYDKIDVVIHRESIVHSMVTYRDGSTIAQLGMPDMCIPIQYALSYPERLPAPWPRVNLSKIGSLSFYPPDHDAFPCLRIAYEAGKKGGSAPVVLNAANEEAVKLLLEERIAFSDIPRIISSLLEQSRYMAEPSLEDIVHIDSETREQVHNLCLNKTI